MTFDGAPLRQTWHFRHQNEDVVPPSSEAANIEVIMTGSSQKRKLARSSGSDLAFAEASLYADEDLCWGAVTQPSGALLAIAEA